jgi:hypothetical protein
VTLTRNRIFGYPGAQAEGAAAGLGEVVAQGVVVEVEQFRSRRPRLNHRRHRYIKLI